MNNARVLIVEDEDPTRYLSETLLRKHGYEVVTARNTMTARKALTQGRFDLVLLDLNLPDGNGFDLAALFSSKQPQTHIIVMTVRTRPEERALCLKSGASDYLIKPFHPDELIYRVHTVLQQKPRGEGHLVGSDKRRAHFNFGSWTLDLDRRELMSENGGEVQITHGEFELLTKLALSKGRVLTRESLLESVSRSEGGGHFRSIDVLISRLRKKFLQAEGLPIRIISVPGVGYKLVTSAVF